jgi:hypothetical protein
MTSEDTPKMTRRSAPVQPEGRSDGAEVHSFASFGSDPPTAFLMTDLPQSIDQVVTRLQAIVADCTARADRNGYFAALYLRMTLAVREGIRKGEFQDGARMERLDVMFAGRYIAAWDQYLAGELPSRSWYRAFAAAANPDLMVLQCLLAGINAHINLDLGIAAARTSAGPALAGLRGDFDRINDVLARLTPTVEGQMDHLSPVFRAVTALAPRLDLKVVGFSMVKARAEAWALAQKLAPLRHLPQVDVMARRDLEVSLIADAITLHTPITRAIQREESRDVAANIRLLAAGTFEVPKPAVPLPMR